MLGDFSRAELKQLHVCGERKHAYPYRTQWEGVRWMDGRTVGQRQRRRYQRRRERRAAEQGWFCPVR